MQLSITLTCDYPHPTQPGGILQWFSNTNSQLTFQAGSNLFFFFFLVNACALNNWAAVTQSSVYYNCNLRTIKQVTYPVSVAFLVSVVVRDIATAAQARNSTTAKIKMSESCIRK